jgi:hypothetical protein
VNQKVISAVAVFCGIMSVQVGADALMRRMDPMFGSGHALIPVWLAFVAIALLSAAAGSLLRRQANQIAALEKMLAENSPR